MKILPVSEITELDAYTITNEPIDSIDLMERASKVFVKRFQSLFPTSLELKTNVEVFVGPGNNGGDALAIARLLPQDLYDVKVYMLASEAALSTDAKINYQRLRKCEDVPCVIVDRLDMIPEMPAGAIIIDGLFGSGLNRSLTGWFKKVVQFINSLSNTVVAIDMPSGLMGEDNSLNDPLAIVKASCTISFQMPKLAFLLAENEPFVGRWFVDDIGLHAGKLNELSCSYELTTNEDIAIKLKNRSRFAHKGTFGHALLLAGSYGKMGAAVLASKACLKSGVGLLTSHVPRLGYNIIQTAVPEVMASIDRSEILISEHPDLDRFAAIGVGPGIGTKPNTKTALKELLLQANGLPLVLDADAVNILADCEETLSHLPYNSVLTPHPGEFDRLAGPSVNAYERLQKAIAFAIQYKIVLVLKGAYTAVIDREGLCYMNSSGNAGMATAGSGDVLTGMILAFLAQGYSALEAARIAVFIHGRAADLYVDKNDMHSLVAGDLIEYIGLALRSLDSKSTF